MQKNMFDICIHDLCIYSLINLSSKEEQVTCLIDAGEKQTTKSECYF